MLRPHELIPWLFRHKLWPEVTPEMNAEYWRCMGNSSVSPDTYPLWIWGDDAQYLEESQESITVICFGVLQHRDIDVSTVRRCWPVVIYGQDEPWLLDGSAVSCILKKAEKLR